MKTLFSNKTFPYFRRKLGLNLAFEYFISKKTLKSVVQGKKVSKPIVRISVISIALAVIVNLITIAVVIGFQQKVRQKVSGFGSHIFIMNSGEASLYESTPIRIDQSFVAELKKDKTIRSISPVGYKPVLFQSEKKEIKYTLPNGIDTSEIQQNVYGAIIKGVSKDFDYSFFKENLIEGKLPQYVDDSISSSILISKRLVNDLNFSIGDEVNAFFVKNQPVKKKFIICGIYKTGLEEFDKKIVIGDLKNIQKLNDWGISSTINISDTLYKGSLILEADITGGNGNYRCDWGKGFEPATRITFYPTKDTIIRLIATDFWSNVTEPLNESTLADTAYLKITIDGIAESICDFKFNDLDELDRNYLNKSGTKFSLKASNKVVNFEIIAGKGSFRNYIGGFELMVNDWEQLDIISRRLKDNIEFIPTKYDELLAVSDIRENQSDIFIWLGFLDVNVIIILTLMILIGIINMGSALLVLILIRTNFIGMLKTMGATNWSIRKIFLIQAAFLIGKGMLWGNIIGLGFCFVQSYFGVITLNPEVYYLREVPIQLNFSHWLILNLVTLIVCISALIIPSIVITRINPVKAIKFN